MGAFKRGRATNSAAHALLVQLFDLQVEYIFLLSLKWIPTAEIAVADAISRPSREAIIRITPPAFREVWDTLGPFNVDLMTCTASALRPPESDHSLPFFSQYDCAGSAGTDVLAQDVSLLLGWCTPAFRFCPPPFVMVGHVV